jgi:hypothetical protein
MKQAHNGPYLQWVRARVKPQKPALLTKELMKGRYVRYSIRTESWQFQDSVTMAWRNVSGELARCLQAAGYETQQQLELFP